MAPVFAINNATGAIVISKTSAALLPAGTVFCQSLLVTDAGGLRNLDSGPGYTGAASVVCVTVVASNNPPVVYPSTFSIRENAPATSPIGSFNATDPQGYPLTFAILSGNVNGCLLYTSPSPRD